MSRRSRSGSPEGMIASLGAASTSASGRDRPERMASARNCSKATGSKSGSTSSASYSRSRTTPAIRAWWSAARNRSSKRVSSGPLIPGPPDSKRRARLDLHVEAAVHRLALTPCLFDTGDPRPGRSPPQSLHERVERVPATLRLQLHRAVVLVPHPAAQPECLGLADHEIAETDTLDAAAHHRVQSMHEDRPSMPWSGSVSRKK